MDYETVLFEQADNGVATITLNRPDRMNSFNRKMAEEFRSIWHRVRDDRGVRAIVLRASEGKAFCSGVDVKEGWQLPGMEGRPFDFDDPGEWLGPKQHKVWKPVVCAIHGIAAGGAFYWINEADIVICSDDAQFFDPHVTFGLVAAVEPVGMRGRVSSSEILRMSLMGNDERIGAQTALRISLVTEVTTREGLWERANEIAASIASKPATAIQGTVRALWESQSLPQHAAVENALKYTQIGNPVSRAEVDRAAMPKVKWVLR